MRYVNLLILFCVASSTLNAQNENKKWVFGQNAGMDFTSGSPVPLLGTSLTTDDNSAAISDAAGNLLFYSNGVTVWNSQNNVMSNGTGLMGHISGGQPATIVPHPGNPNLYYLFTVDAWAFSNGLRYSIIDMSLQSGLGAVTSTKNVLLYSPASEKVIAVKHCNRHDYWLITHNWNSNEFRVYLIDNNGLNTTPVSSYTGTVHTGGTSGFYNAAGQISVSENGKRIGLAIYDMALVEIFDFDNSTGVVSNPISVSGFQNAWGVEFSRSGNVCYITRWQGSALWQIDLLAGNAAAIQASTYLVANPTSPHPTYKSGYLKRGPDDKIYVAKYNSTSIGVIDSPELLGASCNYIDNGFNLGGPLSKVGFDNCTYQHSLPQPSIVSSGLCEFTFNLSDTTGISNVYWNFGDPLSGSQDTSTLWSASHTFSTSGTYTVQCIIDYDCYQDTLIQVISASANIVAGFTTPTVICSQTASFINTTSGASGYLWDFGDSTTSTQQSPTHVYQDTGTFTVTLIAISACGNDTVSSIVTIATQPTISVSGIDTVCAGQTVTISASGANNYQWSGGSTATTSTINVAPIVTTNYIVIGTNNLCSSAPDTFVVTVLPAEIAVISGISPICTGQTVTLSASGGTLYQWSGGASGSTSSITVSPTTTTTYYVMPSSGLCPAVPDTFTVVVYPVPIVNAGGNTQICAGQSTTLTASGGTSFQWSGGATDTTVSITVSPLITTTYFVTTSNGYCTSGFDTITVNVLPSPTVSIIGPANVCLGSTVTLTAVGTATTLLWGGGATGTGTTVTDVPTSTTNYWVIGYNSFGCSDTAITTVGIYDPQSPAILADDTICLGETLQLICAGTGTYVWTPSTSLNNSTVQTPIASPTVTTTYFVQLTDANGCIGNDSHTVYVDACTGINSLTSSIIPIEIYPNPTSGSFNLDAHQNVVERIQIYSATGAMIKEQVPDHTTENFSIDLSSFEDGIYLVRIFTDRGDSIERIVLCH